MAAGHALRPGASLLGQRPLFVVGAFPSRGVEVADLVSDIPGARVAGFIETEDRGRCDRLLEGLPVHWIDEIGGLSASHCAVCAGSIRHRLGVWRKVAEAGLPFATVIHPSASISDSVAIGEGTVVNRAVAIAVQARLGCHVYVNRAVSIGHHTEIGDFAELNPGVTISGQCTVGSEATIGAGSVVIDRRTIGRGTFVCAGSVVTKDLPASVTAAGGPARVIRNSVAPPEF